MLYWAFVFLIIALVAGALGLSGISGAALLVSRVLFGIFLFFFIIALLFAFLAV